jgi:hypothetical protein
LLGSSNQATLQRRTNIKSSRYTAGGGRPYAAYAMLRRRAAAQHSAAERAKKVKLFRWGLLGASGVQEHGSAFVGQPADDKQQQLRALGLASWLGGKSSWCVIFWSYLFVNNQLPHRVLTLRVTVRSYAAVVRLAPCRHVHCCFAGSTAPESCRIRRRSHLPPCWHLSVCWLPPQPLLQGTWWQHLQRLYEQGWRLRTCRSR